ncbi:tRNA uridine-5-carboxymethylaminomethyl(34) synthesis GTPase MnmE [Opitutaceae bacterium TAV3]|nr:tRNA uridine-5-carboxymethylaminomethyl(34) synthesis GTPase MnmE [Opitutaceae bacterium TAV3]
MLAPVVSTDTIVALATPAGTSAIAVIRASGPACAELVAALFPPSPPLPRRATHVDYHDVAGKLLDDVLVTWFRGPRSYTGEDSLEIACHGNPLIAQLILADLFQRGCRPAEAGEFTRRAFLNGRIDLSQAEAVMDLIHARSERALAAANQQLRGSLGRHLATLTDALLLVLARIEAYIDFPDEDLPDEDRRIVADELASVLRGTNQLLATSRYGELLREGIKTVIIGEPNAGKSSLLNRLVGRDRALVSPEPGTTRDFIEELIIIGPHALRLIDTAGLNPTPGAIEKLGIDKTLERAAEADLFLWVQDATLPSPALPPEIAARLTPANAIILRNKTDLLERPTSNIERPTSNVQGPASNAQPNPMQGTDGEAAHSMLDVGCSMFDVRREASLSISALTGAGFDELSSAITTLADALAQMTGDELIAINARHADALRRALDCLTAAQLKLSSVAPTELLASDLRGALDALGEIAGKIDNERMLDHLFATFCIGK